jgi:hypothetical protein
LPNISYATLIDFYVLLCFVAAFLITLLQMLAAMGVIAEPILQTFIGNKTALQVGDAPRALTATRRTDEGVVYSAASDRVVLVPLFIVYGGGFWLLLHVGFLIWYVRDIHVRELTDAFWRAPATSVWLGPIDLSNRDAARTQIRTIFSQWGTVMDVTLWTAAEARVRVDAARDRDGRAEVPYYPYYGTSDFAVITFLSEEGAANAVVHANDESDEATGSLKAEFKKQKPPHTAIKSAATNACRLNLSYVALAAYQTAWGRHRAQRSLKRQQTQGRTSSRPNSMARVDPNMYSGS